MQSVMNSQFHDFVKFLVKDGILDWTEVREILDYLGGMDVIVRKELEILGYEALGFHISRKLSFFDLKSLIQKNASYLSNDSGDRYFFMQALLDNPNISSPEKKTLIGFSPELYKNYLFGKFFPQ